MVQEKWASYAAWVGDKEGERGTGLKNCPYQVGPPPDLQPDRSRPSHTYTKHEAGSEEEAILLLLLLLLLPLFPFLFLRVHGASPFLFLFRLFSFLHSLEEKEEGGKKGEKRRLQQNKTVFFVEQTFSSPPVDLLSTSHRVHP